MDIANTEKVSNTLERIEKELDMLGLWKIQRPNISKFDSETPFCMDSMNFHEWLQFVLIERFREMIKTYGSLPIYFSVAKKVGTLNPTGMVISFRVLKVDLRRDKVVLTCQKEDGSNAAISSFNTNTQSSTDYMNVSFKFSRAVEDYCEPITLAAYRDEPANDWPYKEEEA